MYLLIPHPDFISFVPCRLKVLAARQQVLNDLFAEARANLKSISSNTSQYAELLKNLILQVRILRFFSFCSKQTTIRQLTRLF